MTNAELNILFLDSALEIPWQKKAKILSMYDIDRDLYTDFEQIENELKNILSAKEFMALKKIKQNNLLEKYIKEYQDKNIQIVSIYNENYPELLKEGVEPPFCLYCKGNIQLLNSTCIGVVGTRKITDYGKVVTGMFCKEFAINGITVVSGMALGVDTVAHETTIANNGQTIAVLGGGFDHIYPASNHTLFNKMVENNLVISEYPPHAEPLAYNFPVRNRIIAGLSLGVLVTEAGLKSGALHTKNYAVDCGREVFAVPGKITSCESEGTNNIIRSCQATMATCPNDIFDALHINLKKVEEKPIQQLDINTTSILNYILAEKKTFQEIADYTNLSTKELNNILINMQMDGLIMKLPGNAYIATR